MKSYVTGSRFLYGRATELPHINKPTTRNLIIIIIIIITVKCVF